MSAELQQIRIGLTQTHQCNYLPDQQERVAVALDEFMQTPTNYEILLANGFRRSGETIYKPHCETCHACEALRVSLADFKASKSQKRLLNKAKAFHWEVKNTLDDDWFALYSEYISARHSSGSMFPPNKQEFESFATTHWMESHFIHVYYEDKLVAIAVTDILPHSTSAFYTFFDPKIDISLGTLCVLYQIEHAKKLDRQWLYLGYQIDQCPAMSYKVRFQRHQRLVNHRWQG
ncbi:arginyltransferase [Vibrio maerlii]|uniref:arginyltransferase n=1 Tax=Vibrio maerlii TaxID=2231648 RepID=UPI000E3DB917|nr:arginyltransferase [Vibrio maerlii]